KNLKPQVIFESCLIVEDSLLIAMDVKKKITSLGAQRVFVAGTTSRARKYLQNERPSVVVLDINLGNETTIELARELGEKH
ncbi:response regulator, partial [Opacimonas viscosa]